MPKTSAFPFIIPIEGGGSSVVKDDGRCCDRSCARLPAEPLSRQQRLAAVQFPGRKSLLHLGRGALTLVRLKQQRCALQQSDDGIEANPVWIAFRGNLRPDTSEIGYDFFQKPARGRSVVLHHVGNPFQIGGYGCIIEQNGVHRGQVAGTAGSCGGPSRSSRMVFTYD